MPGNAEKFEKAMNQGHSAAWDQSWGQAATCYRQALEEFPNHPKAITSLALAWFEQKEYGEALSCYKRASELLPEDPVPFEKAAECLVLTGEVSQAVESYLRSAELYIKNKEVDKALSLWKRVLTLSPENIMAHSRLAIVYERQGHKPEAMREYLGIAALLQHAGHVTKSLQATERALQIAPDNPEAQQALAMLKAGRPLPKPGLVKEPGAYLQTSGLARWLHPKKRL
jgi:tetratricopeptide (TPR) repeat protein